MIISTLLVSQLRIQYIFSLDRRTVSQAEIVPFTLPISDRTGALQCDAPAE